MFWLGSVRYGRTELTVDGQTWAGSAQFNEGGWYSESSPVLGLTDPHTHTHTHTHTHYTRFKDRIPSSLILLQFYSKSPKKKHDSSTWVRLKLRTVCSLCHFLSHWPCCPVMSVCVCVCVCVCWYHPAVKVRLLPSLLHLTKHAALSLSRSVDEGKCRSAVIKFPPWCLRIHPLTFDPGSVYLLRSQVSCFSSQRD